MANVPTWNQALPDPGFYTQDALRKATEYRERQAARLTEQEAAIKQAQHEADSRPFDVDMFTSSLADKYGKSYGEFMGNMIQKEGFSKNPFSDDKRYMTGYDIKALQERIKTKKDLMSLDAKERVRSLSEKLYESKRKLEEEQRALGIDPNNPQGTQLSFPTPKLQKIQDEYNRDQQEYKKAAKMWTIADPEESSKFLGQHEPKTTATEHATVKTPSSFQMGVEGLVPQVTRYDTGRAPSAPLDPETAKALNVAAESTIRGIVGNIKDYPDRWPGLTKDDKDKLTTAVAGLDIGTDQDKQRKFEEVLGVLARYESTYPLFEAYQTAYRAAMATGSIDAPRVFTSIWRYELQKTRNQSALPTSQDPATENLISSSGVDKETARRIVNNEMGNRNIGAAPIAAAPARPAPAGAGLPKVPATMGDWGPGQGAPYGTAAVTAPPPTPDNSLAGVPLGDNTVGDNTVKKEAAPPTPPKTRQETKDAYLDERMNVWVSKDHKWMWVPKYKSNKPPYGVDPKTRKPLMEQVYEKVPYNPNYIKPNPGIFRS